MIDDIPELRELRLHRAFVVEALLPELVRASAQGIVKHVNGSPELLPKNCFPGGIHFNTPNDFCFYSVSTLKRIDRPTVGGTGQRRFDGDRAGSAPAYFAGVHIVNCRDSDARRGWVGRLCPL